MSVFVIAAGARVLGFAFVVLLLGGLWSRRFVARGYRLGRQRAAQRFVRGEIDADTYRRYRDDLVWGTRR